eukprot:SAG31_NODE_6165_length_2141_cov_1.959354_2_plen_178_part_00
MNRLGPGQHFGEGALVTAEPRTAYVVAATDCRLLVLTRDDMTAVLREFPEAERMYKEKARSVVSQARKEQDMGNAVFHDAMGALKTCAASYGAFETNPNDQSAIEAALQQSRKAMMAVQSAMNCPELKSPRVKAMLSKKQHALNSRLNTLENAAATVGISNSGPPPPDFGSQANLSV